MDELDLLKTIRPIWISRATQSLAHGSGLRDNLRPQLERFFELLEQAVETGDPSWLDPILQIWATSLTESELENSWSNLTIFLRDLLNLSFEICRETLPDNQALSLIGILLPVFSHASQRIAQYEMESKIAYISNQLTQVRQTLERLDRSKSDFIAVAAHELKTPLTLIEGYAAILRETMEAQKIATPTSVELLTGISNGTHRLHDIINDMIDVSMIDNDLLSLSFQPVWLNRLFKILENEAQPAINERHQKLEIRNFPGCNEMTFADPERLLQAFRNLLSNAVKYTPDGGTIRIDGRKLPGFIEIMFQDTGIGIAPEDQALIFEKFGRLGNTALHSSSKIKFKGGGPGLGLHIAKGIIEAHGGTIWVESTGYDENRCPGSTFHVFLPIRTDPPNDPSARLFAPLSQPTHSS
jgi:signal transduction histidine kinase